MFVATAGVAAGAATDVHYAPPGAWVLPSPAPTQGTTRPDAPVRVAYTDNQVLVGLAGEESYTAYRMTILKPEALQAGNVTISWNPGSGDATVHRLNIIRDGQVIDALKGAKFQVIQREGGLEQSILNGQLTALMQIPGLQIGDELEFGATIRQRDPTLGDHAFGIAQLPTQGMPGAFRYRLSWPDAKPLHWRATRDLPQSTPTAADGRKTLVYELRDPGGAIINEGAPSRFNIRRLIEYSDFGSWGDVSKRFWPLFSDASRLAPNSPLRATAANIAAASADPAERAQAALRLVQDQIRYVYVGLDGGNYRPSSADETWTRRFGDCKAKTAVLLALLRELGIDAEAVLVNTFGGDGTDERLPNPSMFNHVLVRARIGGSSYWLDGTRLGDRYLDRLPAPSFRWALALRQSGGDLEPVTPQALDRPEFVGFVDIDASAGVDKPAKIKAQHIMRQDDAYAIRLQLSAVAAEDADRSLRNYWRQQMNWVEADAVSWQYDERNATLLLTLSGEGKPEWKGDAKEGHRLTLIGAGFFAPDQRRRAKEQDQTAPWATEFPRFKCWATTIRLPVAAPGRRWDYYADPMHLSMGGRAYWRASGLKGNILRTVMSSRVYLPEISATEAREVNDRIPGFNNNMSSVFEEDRASGGKATTDPLPFADDMDWTGDDSVCAAPKAKTAG